MKLAEKIYILNCLDLLGEKTHVKAFTKMEFLREYVDKLMNKTPMLVCQVLEVDLEK